MPRTVHPQAKQGHSRSDIRQQRSRYIKRRWQRNKALYREETGALVINMNSRRLQKRCSQELLESLADVLNQDGPTLFLHPEALRRLPQEMRRSVEKCLGINVLGGNELARSTSAHDRVIDKTLAVQHSERDSRPRCKRERDWKRYTEEDTLPQEA